MYRVGCAGGRQQTSGRALPTGEKNGPHHHQLGCLAPDTSSLDRYGRVWGTDRCRVWWRRCPCGGTHGSKARRTGGSCTDFRTGGSGANYRGTRTDGFEGSCEIAGH